MAEQETKPKSISLFSPEGIIVMNVALLADIGGFLLGLIPMVGWALNIILVIFVSLLFFSLRLSRKFLFKKRMVVISERIAKIESIEKGIVTTAKAVRIAPRIAKWLRWLRWLRPIIELIPYLNFVPLWTICAYLELKYPSY